MIALLGFGDYMARKNCLFYAVDIVFMKVHSMISYFYFFSPSYFWLVNMNEQNKQGTKWYFPNNT